MLPLAERAIRKPDTTNEQPEEVPRKPDDDREHKPEEDKPDNEKPDDNKPNDKPDEENLTKRKEPRKRYRDIPESRRRLTSRMSPRMRLRSDLAANRE